MDQYKISGGMIARLTGLVLRSSLSQEDREDILSRIPDMYQNESKELEEFLLSHELDLTQLSNYTNKDIQKRLNFVDANENY